jgi:NAD+ diphosphatase
MAFPRLDPVVIVAITRGNRILLARARRFQKVMFSLVAGFVEVGETLEQAIHREVREEVGVKVKNLHYVASQPWPFPHSLMIGFTAEYAGGEVVPDGEEVLEADWFAATELPPIPDRASIARRLIDRFVSQQGADRYTD